MEQEGMMTVLEVVCLGSLIACCLWWIGWWLYDRHRWNIWHEKQMRKIEEWRKKMEMEKIVEGDRRK